eukprot:3640457-Rhodomonas_salina.1
METDERRSTTRWEEFWDRMSGAEVRWGTKKVRKEKRLQAAVTPLLRSTLRRARSALSLAERQRASCTARWS